MSSQKMMNGQMEGPKNDYKYVLFNIGLKKHNKTTDPISVDAILAQY